MGNAIAVLYALASSQHGLASRAQALAAGLSERQLEYACATGVLERVRPGVYRIAGTPPSWRQTVLAGVLAAGDGAVASHRTGAVLCGYEGARPGLIDVSSVRWLRRPRGDRIVVHETTDLRPKDCTVIDGIPVTTPLRTLIDSGCLVPIETLDTWLDQGIREGWFSVAAVEKRRREVARRGRNGVGPLRLLLKERARSDRVTHSGFEVRLSRLVARGGFIRPERQVLVCDATGVFIGHADLGYPAFRTVLEADSITWHLNRRSFHEDRKRWNRMKAAGWEVLVYTWHHVHKEPNHVLSTLSDVLHLQADRLGLDYAKLRS